MTKSNYDLQDAVIAKIGSLLEKFNKKYNKFGSMPPVKFTKRGKTAGCVSYKGGEVECINFNMVLLKENFEHFISQTVTHELAHFCVYVLKGHQYNGRRRIIHGNDFKQMMSFFGVAGDRCHSYDTSNSCVTSTGKKLKRFTYKCACQTHELTSIRHNRARRGQRTYKCTKCGCKLELV